ncbi:MAG TPA: undecaprenyl-diphosphate phosphatase [Actinomycetes bacterium]|nr:undecaprenyl-diphosphate phosphatase [Actinomycetes bacterium]
MSWVEAILLGILQGLTEFLPISSSAHLAIFPQLFGSEDPGASFTAVTQIGTELAVIWYFRVDIWRIASTWLRSLVQPRFRGQWDARMGWYIIVGTVPIAVAGVLLEDTIQTSFRNLWVVGVNMVLFGILLGIFDRIGANERSIERLTFRHALWYGAAQMLALVPGVSRSGATITMGLALRYTREAATRYAFLLAIPAVVASAIFQIPDVSATAEPGLPKTLAATVVAFVIGYAVVAWLLRYLRTHSYLPFVIYRITLGLLVLVLLWIGVLEPDVPL